MSSVTAGAVARTIILLVALLNQILAMSGKHAISIADNDIYQTVSLIFTIGASVWAWWKNNSFTQNAIKADEVLKQLKGQKKSEGGEVI